MSMYEEGSEECFICERKLDSNKIEVEWFVLAMVDYDADYDLYEYTGKLCHYDCYNNWQYKAEYEKEVKRFKEHIVEFNKRLENANEAERQQIYEEETRRWNEKVKKKHPEVEDIPEDESSDDDPWNIPCDFTR